MKELEPRQDNERFDGDHVEVNIVSPRRLHRLVNQPDYFASLDAHVDDNLPYPLHSTSFEIWSSPDDLNKALASISFVPPAHSSDWKALVMNELLIRRTESHYELNDHPDRIIKLDHEDDTFYVNISPNYFVRVGTRTDVKTCFVELELQHRETLEETLERSIDYDPSVPDDNNYQRVRSLAELWGQTIDSVASIYAEQSKSLRKYRLNLAVPPTALAADDEIVENFAPPTIPEIEQATASENSLHMIGGLTHAKRRLTEIITIFNDPEGASMYGVSGSHFILHGPPGTGKTSLVTGLAYELSAQIQHIPSTKVIGKYIGESAKNMEAVFDTAAEASANGPVIMFFDEIDALVSKKGNPHSERLSAVKVMNAKIEEIRRDYAGKIIIAGATNVDIDDLEESIVRSGRLEPIAAPLPTQDERVEVWAAVLWKSIQELHNGIIDPTTMREFSPYDTDINPPLLAGLTDGMTGADFEKILERARVQQFRLFKSTGVLGKVSHDDIVHEITNFSR